jgi:hypothetical protein
MEAEMTSLTSTEGKTEMQRIRCTNIQEHLKITREEENNRIRYNFKNKESILKKAHQGDRAQDRNRLGNMFHMKTEEQGDKLASTKVKGFKS